MRVFGKFFFFFFPVLLSAGALEWDQVFKESKLETKEKEQRAVIGAGLLSWLPALQPALNSCVRFNGQL